jgi:hypothetical protein
MQLLSPVILLRLWFIKTESFENRLNTLYIGTQFSVNAVLNGKRLPAFATSGRRRGKDLDGHMNGD